MTETDALELLKHHSFTHDDIENPKSEKGFLGMLRPYKGDLYEKNFHELMAIIIILKPHLKKDKIDRKIISSFWSICHLGRAWALEPNGMLQSNNVISKDQINRLSTWIDCISYTLLNLLDGLEDDVAFESYRFYLEENGDFSDMQ